MAVSSVVVTASAGLCGSSGAAFSSVSREGPPLGLKSMCSIAEARHRRALAESTAMQAHRAGSFSRFTLRMSFGPKGKNNLFFLRPSLL